jgi:hypothetical protein
MTVNLSRYDDTLRHLSHEAIACAPKTWTQGRLTMALDAAGLHYQLESDSDQTPAVLTQQLARLCGELYVLMEMDGQGWSQCSIEFTKTPDDSWSFDVRFTYPKN